MLVFYTIFCLLLLFISTVIYKKIINPVSIYTIIWYFCFFLHEVPSRYYSLSVETFMIIVLTHIVFAIGCLIPRFISFPMKTVSTSNYIINKQVSLKVITIFVSLLVAISIYPNLIHTILMSGAKVLSMGQRYFNDLSAVRDSSFSLSSLSFLESVLAGIYICNYGFSFFLLLPLTNVVVTAMTSGSRGSLIIIMVLFIAPFTLVDKSEKKNDKKKLVLFAIVVLFALFLIVGLSTYSRNIASGNNYSFFSSITRFISGYSSAGIACLNEYLKNPIVFGYPKFTLRVPFILMNKLFSTSFDTYFWLETYYTPSPSNVITYIGELYHDFDAFFLIFVFFLAVLFSFSYEKAIKTKSFSWTLLYSCLFVIFALSFFSNYIHMSPVWIVSVFGLPITFLIDKKQIVTSSTK